LALSILAAAAQPAENPDIPGEAVQVEPMKSKLKAPGTKRLKLNHDIMLSSFAFKFNLRLYTLAVPCRKSSPLSVTSSHSNRRFHRRLLFVLLASSSSDSPTGENQGPPPLVHFSAQPEPFCHFT